jgi:uncharacterized membrane protein
MLARADAAEAGQEEPTRRLERLIVFADAVVAIAITLLALELPVPEGNTNAELWHSAQDALPEYRSFLISFLVIWAYWSAHRTLYRNVTGQDTRLGSLTGLWLLLIVITPFATKVLGGDKALQVRFGFYAGVQALISLVMLVMALHVRSRGLHPAGVDRSRFVLAAWRSGAVAAAFAVSIPLSFVIGGWAYLCWLAIPVLLRLPDLWLSRRGS